MATKKSTLTIAAKKSPASPTGGAKSTGYGGSRDYSTRAKQAARRDGRDLPVARKPKDPLLPIVADDPKADYRSKSAKPPTARRDSGAPPRGDSPSGVRRDPTARSADERGSARRPPAGAGADRSDGRRRPTSGEPVTGGSKRFERGNAAGKPAAASPGAARKSYGEKPRDRSADRSPPPPRPPADAPSPKFQLERPAGRRSTGDNNPRRSPTDAASARASPPAPRPAVPLAPAREPDGTVRVSKLLSEQGLCSRREADSYIARGWVWADGVRVTELGTRVAPTAKITLDQHAAMMQDQRVTVLLNKPVGYVSGQAEDGYQPASVLVVADNQLDTDEVRFEHIHRRGMAPAGRLDIDSTGLLVLTQDGRIAKQLVGENSPVEKEYLVRVEGTLAPGDLERLRHGLELDGEALKPAKVRWQNADQLNFILQEGKKRQIRRMCEMVGLNVLGLKRIRIGNVMLGDLPPGKWRFLRGDESFM